MLERNWKKEDYVRERERERAKREGRKEKYTRVSAYENELETRINLRYFKEKELEGNICLFVNLLY